MTISEERVRPAKEYNPVEFRERERIVMRMWRALELPEWFLGNGGTNKRLVAFADACAALEADAPAISEEHKAEARKLADAIRAIRGDGPVMRKEFSRQFDPILSRDEATDAIAAVLSAAEARGIVKGLKQARRLADELDPGNGSAIERDMNEDRDNELIAAIDARLSVLKAQGEGE